MSAAAITQELQGAKAQDVVVVLSDKVSVTPEQLSKIMSVNKDWPYEGRADPWCLVHNSIRNDMRCLAEALDKLVEQLKTGLPLEAWQVSNLQAWLRVHIAFVHHHHETEEDIFFPWINTRTDLGHRLSADHAKLMTLLDKELATTMALRVTGTAGADLAAIQSLKAVADELHSLMLEHLKEEEDRGLPLMRMHFTVKELRPIEDKIKKNLTPMDMGHLVNHLPTPKQKETMTMLGVPGIIQTLVLMPACKKYDKTVHRLIAELQAGKRTPPKAGCSCFSA